MSKSLTQEEQQELYEYRKEIQIFYLKCLLMEGSKILLFTFTFWKLGLIREYWMTLFVLLLLRTNGGGIHCKHYISCFFVSFVVLYASIVIPLYVHLPSACSLVLLIMSGYLGYRLVPIVSETRPEPSSKVIEKSKRNTVLVISAFFVLICISPYNLYLNIGVWTIIIHIIQLLIAKFYKGGDIE